MLELEISRVRGCQNRKNEKTRIDFVVGEKWSAELKPSVIL